MIEKGPNEPHAWVLLSGLRDFYNPPHGLHTVDELPQILNRWKAARESKWPRLPIERHFAFNWSKGKIAFQADGMGNNPSVDGVMMYGTSSFPMEVTLNELTNLGVTLALVFGQPFVELNLQGVVRLITKNETTKPI